MFYIETFINFESYWDNQAIKIKITIDTKEDSPEEIKKVIRMLSSLIGEQETANQNLFDAPAMPEGSALGALFDDNEQKIEAPKAEEKEEIPQIMEYD